MSVVVKKDGKWFVRKHYGDFTAISRQVFDTEVEAEAAMNRNHIWYELEN